MTAKLDLGREAYLYAQDLDNAGGTDYWRVTSGGTICERLLPVDARLGSVRERLDALLSNGRFWPVGGHHLQCQMNFSGDCVLIVSPQTRDVDGRVSPVLLLFNALGPSREQAVVALAAIPSIMGRELATDHGGSEARLKRILRWPRFIILLHIAVFSRRKANV